MYFFVCSLYSKLLHCESLFLKLYTWDQNFIAGSRHQVITETDPTNQITRFLQDMFPSVTFCLSRMQISPFKCLNRTKQFSIASSQRQFLGSQLGSSHTCSGRSAYGCFCSKCIF
ncbi:carbonic anhydrase 12 [Platysternon megacephalum]|uniref:Carbonic anhydrase 12 n=1 Tax=Platysternon megacephalum TaxID=55544 RepID=A0A4D9ECU4_9SAUR|nr:carbonic anhydrase 12 [Platysternon megacephalum]